MTTKPLKRGLDAKTGNVAEPYYLLWFSDIQPLSYHHICKPKPLKKQACTPASHCDAQNHPIFTALCAHQRDSGHQMVPKLTSFSPGSALNVDNFTKRWPKGSQSDPREPQGWQNACQGHENGVPGPTRMDVLDTKLE